MNVHAAPSLAIPAVLDHPVRDSGAAFTAQEFRDRNEVLGYKRLATDQVGR